MKKQIHVSFLSVIFILVSVNLSAQVGINTSNSNPDPSAGLDVSFPDKGLLPPRVALTAINNPNPIPDPAVGLLVYNTAVAGISPNDVTTGYYCWTGIQWIPVMAPRGTNIGDMQYWNGTQWVPVPAGIEGQILTLQKPTGEPNARPNWAQPVYVYSPQLPAVITDPVSNIIIESAKSGGNVSDGGAPVTDRGICWSTVPDPTVADFKTSEGAGCGPFTSNMTGLTDYTIYYVRAYATNSVGTGYGNQVIFQTLAFQYGLQYQGGVICYLDETLHHGLVSATSDLGTVAQWGCYGISMGTSTALGTGQANTTAILNGCSTAGIAARICNDLVLNGYDDWFLPSRDELQLMYVFRVAIGGFNTVNYWSSSEDTEVPAPAYFAHYIGFYNGGIYWGMKSNECNVRAVRAF